MEETTHRQGLLVDRAGLLAAAQLDWKNSKAIKLAREAGGSICRLLVM
jgi:hypothetical protein